MRQPVAPGRRPPPRRGPRPRRAVRIRSTSGAQPGGLGRRPRAPHGPQRARRPPRPAAGSTRPGVGYPGCARPRRHPAGALAHHQHADPGRAAPLVGAGRSAPTSRSGTGCRPTDCGRVHVERHPGRAQALAAAATGCTVPTSWLALISAASGDARARRPRRRRPPGPPGPSRSTGTHRGRPPAPACAAAACSTAECSMAECTSTSPVRRRPGERARRPRRARRPVPLGQKRDLVRADPHESGDRRRGPRRAVGAARRAWRVQLRRDRPSRPREPASSAARRDRVQRGTGGRVEVRA